MARTRSPALLLVGLVLLLFVPMVVMWAVAGPGELLGRFLLFGVYFLVGHVAVPGWVYLDATRRADRWRTLFTAVAFLVPVAGPVSYVLRRQLS
ncbi:MAG: hypothetical protein RI544_05205 [Haloquadratum sp.]|jgi:hypothetical protein|nr:hypothetical protein [Haloferacaceae archaeon]MDR9445539.1 hypothetical protein [Haloquadratum sp.]